jgi:hypothetical protein
MCFLNIKKSSAFALGSIFRITFMIFPIVLVVGERSLLFAKSPIVFLPNPDCLTSHSWSILCLSKNFPSLLRFF